MSDDTDNGTLPTGVAMAWASYDNASANGSDSDVYDASARFEREIAAAIADARAEGARSTKSPFDILPGLRVAADVLVRFLGNAAEYNAHRIPASVALRAVLREFRQVIDMGTAAMAAPSEHTEAVVVMGASDTLRGSILDAVAKRTPPTDGLSDDPHANYLASVAAARAEGEKAGRAAGREEMRAACRDVTLHADGTAKAVIAMGALGLVEKGTR